LLEITKLNVNLNGPASTVGIDIKETLLKNIKKGVQLGLVVFSTLLLLAKVRNKVTANLDNSAAQSICLYKVNSTYF
jgi:hypothetical protein